MVIGIAYPGVRDNRSTLNTKTGYDDDITLRIWHMGVLKFPGTIVVPWRRKGSQVTWQLAVQFKMC